MEIEDIRDEVKEAVKAAEVIRTLKFAEKLETLKRGGDQMYILTDEPLGGQQANAFEALDDAFGTGEFSQGQAITVLKNALETPNADGLFRSLVQGGHVTETDA